MISILIPVYNRNVAELVTELQRQGMESGLPFDILVGDDGSPEESVKRENALLDRLPHVRYHAFAQNQGARRCREAMAVLATYPDLLLIDGDAAIPDKRYFVRYAERANGRTVVFGGINYPSGPFRDNLRWWYGIHRECAVADRFGGRDGGLLTTFNLLIPKDIFLAGGSPPLLSGYGHEDTLLALQMELDGIRVLHINNPLLHNGLPDNSTFLWQTENAVSNLLVLYRSFKPLSLLRKKSSLIRVFGWLKGLGLLGVYAAWFARNEERMRQQLLSAEPSLRVMDAYKLGRLIHEYRNK